MHTREDTEYAAIDTHILKAMRDFFPNLQIPDKTPTGDQAYERLEQMFLYMCEVYGQTPAALDLEFWTEYSGRGNATKEAA
jgi:thermostable 8-oxoguanine DNA glycosylase